MSARRKTSQLRSGRKTSRTSRTVPADASTPFRTFASFVLAITEPLRQLDELVALAERSANGDTNAGDELRARLSATASAAGEHGLRQLDAQLAPSDSCVSCAPCSTDQRVREREASTGSEADDAALIDQKAVGALLQVASRRPRA